MSSCPLSARHPYWGRGDLTHSLLIAVLLYLVSRLIPNQINSVTTAVGLSRREAGGVTSSARHEVRFPQSAVLTFKARGPIYKKIVGKILSLS